MFYVGFLRLVFIMKADGVTKQNPPSWFFWADFHAVPKELVTCSATWDSQAREFFAVVSSLCPYHLHGFLSFLVLFLKAFGLYFNVNVISECSSSLLVQRISPSLHSYCFSLSTFCWWNPSTLNGFPVRSHAFRTITKQYKSYTIKSPYCNTSSQAHKIQIVFNILEKPCAICSKGDRLLCLESASLFPLPYSQLYATLPWCSIYWENNECYRIKYSKGKKCQD